MIQYDLARTANPAAATVLLSSGLGGAASYWAAQVTALQRNFHVVTYDHVGTGRNAFPLRPGYRVADMAADVLDILDTAQTPCCHFVGHALGALVGLHLAAHAPDRLRTLTLVNGWARVDAHTARCFEARLTLLKHAGALGYIRAQPIFLYPATWLAANQARIEAEDAHALASFQGAQTLRERIGALLAFDATASLATIAHPALVIAARDDVLVPATQSERLAAALPNASLSMAEWGGHAVNVTDPAGFETALSFFLGCYE